MFTGLIEEVGTLLDMQIFSKSAAVKIQASKVLEDVRLGDSIAVDGVCLTVIDFGDGFFTANIMPTTLKSTRFKKLSKGAPVHLERALRVGDRLGGHFVSGHVDGLANVISVKKEDTAIRMKLTCQDTLRRHMVQKGSVTVSGVSLTIDKLTENGFELSLVQHTQGETYLTKLKHGDVVNIESDMLLKYVHSLLGNGGGLQNKEDETKTSISIESLRQTGFL